MPTTSQRVQVVLPKDLQGRVVSDAWGNRKSLSGYIAGIVREHYERSDHKAALKAIRGALKKK